MTLDDRHKIYASMDIRELHVFVARVMFEHPETFEEAAQAVQRYRERRATKHAEQNGANP